MNKIFIILILLAIPLLSHSKPINDNVSIEELRSIVFSNPQKVLDHASKIARQAKKEANTFLYAESMLIASRASTYMGDFDESMVSLYDALDHCPTDSLSLFGKIYMQMSNVYCRLMDFNRSIEFSDKATSMYKIMRDSSGLARCYNNRGIIHTYLEEFTIAEQCFQNALSINRKMGNLKSISANLNNLCLYEGDFNLKIEYIKEAIEISSSSGSIWILAENYNNMGKQYFYVKRDSEAIEALDKALEYAKELGAKELICDNLEYRSWVYYQSGLYKKAYDAQKELATLISQMREDSKLRNIERTISKNNLLELKNSTELKEKELELALMKRNIAIITIILILLIILGVGASIWYKKRKRGQLMLVNYKLEIYARELAELRISQQEHQLSATANELDDTKREITGLAMFIRSRNEILSKIKEMIKDGYKLPSTDLNSHMKKVNLYIAQHQNNEKESNQIMLSIEQKSMDFLKRLTQKYPKLTKGEKHLASMLRANISTKEISILTGSSPKTINMNRYRLRKSLELDLNSSLTEFLQTF